MKNRALDFTVRAEKYAKNFKALAHDGENIAHRIINLAEKVSRLDSRVVNDADRESYLARIWAAYGAVTDYLDSSAPYNLGIPEEPFYGEMLSDMATNADFDGCPGQVIVDNDYHGWDAAMD